MAEGRNRVISLDNYFNGSVANHIPRAEYREGYTKDVGAGRISVTLNPPFSKRRCLASKDERI